MAGPAAPLTIVPPPAGANGDIVLPDLRGLGGREALHVLARLGLGARVTGEGVVLEQEPAAGMPVGTGRQLPARARQERATRAGREGGR